jgi:uncharacterized membrane protein
MSLLVHLHPASVHFPITFLLLASITGLFYLYGRPSLLLRTSVWWSLLLGWLGAVVAVLSGLLAQSGLPPQAPYRAVLNWHVYTGFALLAVYGVLLYQRWLFGSSRGQKERLRAGLHIEDLLDDPRARFRITLLLITGLLLVILTGWNGGRLVYEWGVNVTKLQ